MTNKRFKVYQNSSFDFWTSSPKITCSSPSSLQSCASTLKNLFYQTDLFVYLVAIGNIMWKLENINFLRSAVIRSAFYNTVRYIQVKFLSVL